MGQNKIDSLVIDFCK